MATGDMFIKIEGIEGESQDEKHKNEIQILSWSMGAANAGSSGVGEGSGTSKVNVSDFSFTKLLDKSSPNLFINCCSGKHIATVVLTVRKAGEKPQDYMTMTFNEVLISGYNVSGADGGGLPTESVSLNFSKIKHEYKEQKADGTLGGPISKTYDIKANKVS